MQKQHEQIKSQISDLENLQYQLRINPSKNRNLIPIIQKKLKKIKSGINSLQEKYLE